MHPELREMVDVAVRQTVIGASARGGCPHELDRGPEQRLGPGRGDHRLEDRRRKVLESVTTREYQCADSLPMVYRDQLRDDAAGVVTNQNDISKAKGGKTLSDNAG